MLSRISSISEFKIADSVTNTSTIFNQVIKRMEIGGTRTELKALSRSAVIYVIAIFMFLANIVQLYVCFVAW